MSGADAAGGPLPADAVDPARAADTVVAPEAPRPAIGLVWAEAEGGVIGRDGGMPWHVPEDLAHFKAVTLGAPVVMGRKTWDSLNPRYRPLPGRRNLVVTRQPDWAADGAVAAASVEEALVLAGQVDRVWVIGGSELFALALPLADRLEVTELRHADNSFAPLDDDVLAPSIGPGFAAARGDEQTSATGIRYRFVTYTRASD
ncbi:dihydrofolate reductase [Agromyces sp. CF514]|uniref:dihydrofolate reductase n=1 Tax=Agromyces sp. CF514 TaxID=1881031 RepID=UPI0008EC62CB|nr:dihydrofolate reductase [Agromyces sp. CF514]SFR88533.1 dihydrofolate reductase [Agromyces sp. CF514]